MPEPEPPISLITFTDRLTQRQQIEEVLARAQAKGEPVRVRMPFSLYDAADTRGYVFLRDAVWNLQLPSELTTPEVIEKLIYTIGQCVVAIANEGSDVVIKKLQGEAAA
jgi:hypothetical protein